MTRPTDNVLTWLRSIVSSRGLNTAELSKRCGIPRGRLRRLLAGDEPMLVDEFVTISTALEVSPAELGLPAGVSTTDAEAEAPDAADASTDDEPEAPRFVAIEGTTAAPLAPDPFGNPVEQLIRMGFELGCTFLFWAHVSQLEESGVPESILAEHRERGELLIRLEAEFHRYNQPVFGDEGITLTLSFDQLYDCTFPWPAIHKIIFDVDEDPPDDPPSKPPHLRLVT